MASLKYVEIDGNRHLWRDILKLRRDQREALCKKQEPVLFELKDDFRPAAERTPAGRYLEPSLFG